MPSESVSTTKYDFITVAPKTVKKSNKFTCIGWISTPLFSTDDPLVMLAVSDLSGDAESDEALRWEIVKEGTDYRLQFSNSKTKLIAKTIGAKLDDGLWHFLAYVCYGEGQMKYYVDGIEIAPEDGVGTEGILYSLAWSRDVRMGGGNVWCPYIYKAGQALSVYNVRMAKDITLHQQWLQELMAIDAAVLNPE